MQQYTGLLYVSHLNVLGCLSVEEGGLAVLKEQCSNALAKTCSAQIPHYKIVKQGMWNQNHGVVYTEAFWVMAMAHLPRGVGDSDHPDTLSRFYLV